nr:hypothetical protein [Rhodococcus wratislaviensis]
MFERLNRAVFDRLCNAGELDWTAPILVAVSMRASGRISDRKRSVNREKTEFS